MKIQKFEKAVLVLIFSLFTAGVTGQTTMMSSNPLKKQEMVYFGRYQFYKNNLKYDWNSEDWKQINDAQIQRFHKALPMLGYGITGKLSVYAQVPFSYFDLPEKNEFYLEDMLLMTRYAITPSSGSKTGLTLIGAARFPTGVKGESYYSDGSFDLIIGEILSTRWYHNWRTHIKSEYTFNLRNANDINPGNELSLILKQDYRIGKVQLLLINQYNRQFNHKDIIDDIVPNTGKIRLTHTFLTEYQFRNGLQIRGGTQLGSYSAGGSNCEYKLVVHTIYKFQCGKKKEM